MEGKEARRSGLLALLNRAGRTKAEDRELFDYFSECAASRRFLYRNLPDADWEEVVADAITEILLRCDGSREMSSLVFYFQRRLHLRALDRWRKIPREDPAREGTGSHDRTATEARFEQGIADSQLIEKAVRRLRETAGERYVQVLFLRKVEGRSAREVASMMNLTPGNVDKILSRARIAMRQILLELGGGK